MRCWLIIPFLVELSSLDVDYFVFCKFVVWFLLCEGFVSSAEGSD